MNTGSKRHAKQQGFTLIEIMVVIVILGILGTIVAPKVLKSPDKARVTKAKQDLQVISAALDMYKLDNFNYPDTDQGLEALTQRPTSGEDVPNWQEGGYIKKVPTDPWGRDYLYISPGENDEVDIYSLGSDGAPGGDGTASDIGSWE